MNEQELRELIAAVKAGRVSRRNFTRAMMGLGLTGPFATQLLADAGFAQSPTSVEYNPTRAGGGALRTLFWQAPTLLNPHFAVGAKDAEGAGIFYEPLASWDPNGNLVPVLAAEIPDIENGGVAADGMSVTWKLKTGVQWHDGQPFTADDVVSLEMWEPLPILKGLCGNSCHRKSRPRKTNGSVVMRPAGATRRTTTSFHAAEGELDPVKRAALFIAMNDMVVQDGVVIPVVCRPQVGNFQQAQSDAERMGQHFLEPQRLVSRGVPHGGWFGRSFNQRPQAH